MTTPETHDEAGGAVDMNPLFEKLAERLGSSARAAAVFGDPVERDGVTVIPVARAKWGLGGGGGRHPDRNAAGVGGGGGAMVTPVGYIELRDGSASFEPILDYKALAGIGLAAAALLTLGLLLRRS